MVGPSRIELELSVSETDVLSVTPWDLWSERGSEGKSEKRKKEKVIFLTPAWINEVRRESSRLTIVNFDKRRAVADCADSKDFVFAASHYILATCYYLN